MGAALQRPFGVAVEDHLLLLLADPRLGDRFVEMRARFFPDENFPGSALITISHLARPGMLIEIQGVAVIGG